jgi:histidinol-phosphate aminotransferase
VITRTLSKAYALAGIRVGYALAGTEVIDLLDRVRDSYNVNRLSQAAALAAIEDDTHHRALVARVVATRNAQQVRFAKRGWFTYPSQANFLFTEPRNAKGASGPAIAKSAYDFLYANQVLVRYFPNHELTSAFLRITVGTDPEMKVLQDTLDRWLEQV